MARRAREIFLDIPHHLTQRGNSRQQVFYVYWGQTVFMELGGQVMYLLHDMVYYCPQVRYYDLEIT